MGAWATERLKECAQREVEAKGGVGGHAPEDDFESSDDVGGSLADEVVEDPVEEGDDTLLGDVVGHGGLLLRARLGGLLGRPRIHTSPHCAREM